MPLQKLIYQNKDLNLILNWVNYFEHGNLSQFCKKIDIHVTTPVNWKQKNTGPSSAVIQKVLSAYELTMEDYLAGPNEEKLIYSNRYVIDINININIVK